MRHLISFLLVAAAPSLNSVNIKANDIGVPTSTATIGAGIANIIKILMTVMGSLALVFLIVGGILYAVSAGNAKRISQAREAILYSIVGLVVAISAYAIVSFIASSLK